MQDDREGQPHAKGRAADGSAEAEVPAIQFRPGVYARGRETVSRILEAALDILIHEGSQAMTLRRIAAACGLRIGNVTYYFTSKEDLLRAVLDVVAAGYTEAITDLRSRMSNGAQN